MIFNVTLLTCRHVLDRVGKLPGRVYSLAFETITFYYTTELQIPVSHNTLLGQISKISTPDKRGVSGKKAENTGFLTQQNEW